MSLLEEIPKEPVALECNSCGAWSKYDLGYNDRLPRGWREDDKGFHCTVCVNGRRKK